jgi:glycosyltransferase involved in cell wall biosynthesis
MSSIPTPIVSVITAFFNEERFLAEAIESVLRQDFSHWELVLVDDGSTDGSTAIAQRYAQLMPDKILYCDHADHVNKGLSASRNWGIQHSHAPLIALLDADDVWRPGKLTQQLAIIAQHPTVGMLAEASVYWHQWQKSSQDDVLVPVGAPAAQVYKPGELLLILYPLGPTTAAAPCPSGLLFTREAYVKVGGFEESFTENYQLYEDQAFLSKIYLNEQVYVSAASNNLYRQRPGSIMKAVTEQGNYHIVRRYFLTWLATYLHARGPISPALQQALAHARFPYEHPLCHRLMSSFPLRAARRLVNQLWSGF